MVSEREAVSIRKFVCGQLRDEADLSTLTLGILKKRYLAHTECETLSPEARSFMKRVVQDELTKMQVNDKNGSQTETKKIQSKRKREKEHGKVISGSEDGSKAKKSRTKHSSSPSESEDKEELETGREESDDEEHAKSQGDDKEQEMKKSQGRRNGIQKINSDDSSDEELNESERKGNNCNSKESTEEMVGKNGEMSSNKGKGMKTQSDEENETDGDSKSAKSDKANSDESSDSEKEEKVSLEKKSSDSDSDSSSLPSLDDEKDNGTGKTKDKKKMKKKHEKKDVSTKRSKKDEKSVARLKRYIALCGVRRNYKKLLQGCHSVHAQVAVLKKELEELGVHDQPSIQKCKKVRKQREEAQELAALDVNNIINTEGRPTRRGASGKQKHDSSSSKYERALNSDSDGDQENIHKGRRKISDWTNLQGIISDDADSD